MSYDDDHRPHPDRSNPDRGAYTPPTDDDLPFHRTGYDARRAPARRPLPLTLIASGVILLLLIIAVVLFYRSGVRASGDAPPAVGSPVGELTAPAPVEAQPVDPTAGIDVYLGESGPAATEPQFVPPPEAAQPRPTAPEPTPAAPAPATPAPVAKAPPPAPAPAPAPAPTPDAAATSGASAVQIGAFSSTAVADREYAAVAAAFPQFARGRTKGVEAVTAANGSTLYRTTVNGFSREEAQRFCAALRAGGRDCLVR